MGMPCFWLVRQLLDSVRLMFRLQIVNCALGSPKPEFCFLNSDSFSSAPKFPVRGARKSLHNLKVSRHFS